MSSSSEIVTIIVRSNQLVCTWLYHSKKDMFSFRVRAFQRFQADFIHSSQASLINSTYMMQCVREFFGKHSLKNPFVLCALDSQTIYENYYVIEQESQAMADIQAHNKSLVWNYCVLDQAGGLHKTLLYVYGLSRCQIFQYQLAALATPFNCIFITTVHRALLQLLWSIRGGRLSSEVVFDQRLDFRSSLPWLIKFLDFQNNQNENSYTEDEVEALCASMGLYLLGENYESI